MALAVESINDRRSFGTEGDMNTNDPAAQEALGEGQPGKYCGSEWREHGSGGGFMRSGIGGRCCRRGGGQK